MRETNERAYAKLNISLDIVGKRPDGYHDMVMVMQSVSLCDELCIRLNDTGELSAVSDLHFIPNDERNLAVRAARQFLDAAGEPGQGVEISMKKRIPVGAGMAGGSADAAAVLRSMNRLYGGRFSTAELEEIAAGIGSDVAFCVAGGTALAQGRGELLTRLPDMPECYFAICKPGFSISTPELFRSIDSAPLRHHPDTAGILESLDRGELEGICRRLYNVFEDVSDRRIKTVGEIKSRLLDCGAAGAVMTGTGSAVFGIFTDAATARKAQSALLREYRFCCVAEPVKPLV